MEITGQDKRDIKETILWLNEAIEWIENMGGADIDGEPNWNNNVSDAVNVANEWLYKIIKENK